MRRHFKGSSVACCHSRVLRLFQYGGPVDRQAGRVRSDLSLICQSGNAAVLIAVIGRLDFERQGIPAAIGLLAQILPAAAAVFGILPLTAGVRKIGLCSKDSRSVLYDQLIFGLLFKKGAVSPLCDRVEAALFLLKEDRLSCLIDPGFFDNIGLIVPAYTGKEEIIRGRGRRANFGCFDRDIYRHFRIDLISVRVCKSNLQCNKIDNLILCRFFYCLQNCTSCAGQYIVGANRAYRHSGLFREGPFGRVYHDRHGCLLITNVCCLNAFFKALGRHINSSLLLFLHCLRRRLFLIIHLIIHIRGNCFLLPGRFFIHFFPGGLFRFRAFCLLSRFFLLLLSRFFDICFFGGGFLLFFSRRLHCRLLYGCICGSGIRLRSGCGCGHHTQNH